MLQVRQLLPQLTHIPEELDIPLGQLLRQVELDRTVEEEHERQFEV